MLLGRDLKARYTGSLIGFFWSIVNPLLYIAVFTLVFGVFLKVRFVPGGGGTDFLRYLLAGILPWFMLQEAVLRCTTAFTDNRELVKSVRFPSFILPLSMVLSSFVNHLAGLLVLTLVLLATKTLFIAGAAEILVLLFLFLLLVSLSLGIGVTAAVVHNYFRDMSHLMGALLLIWMYASPIFYPPEIADANHVPRFAGIVIALNPLTHIIGGYRSVFLGAPLPAVGLLYAAAASFFILGVGLCAFVRHRGRFPELL